MKRILTICTLACLLVAGAAVASIVVRGKASLQQDDAAGMSVIEVTRGPIANRQSKADKLPLSVALASFESASSDPDFNEPLRKAFAAAADSPIGNAEMGASSPAAPSSQATGRDASKEKPTAKQLQKNYALLSDVQISAIKGRLNLSAAQEPLWPPVEDALRAVARKIHETKLTKRAAGTPPIDPASAEVQQLKSAAMPLLFQLREDQKREVRSLARIIGLEQVASQF